ncbi:21 kDa subunit of NADH dehydrogenase [Amanita rubescens]|nr:21 kDa subunit of NADH dehydrogenase [Amanita rubescens]
MATKKAADATLYHLSPKGFWKKFRDAFSANPDISSGLPIATLNRNPQPASRPEKYSTPATKASDPAQNPYWKRDVRRSYPQLSVITQGELSSLLVEHSGIPAMGAPATQASVSEGCVPSAPKLALDLSQAIASITETAKLYTESKLPPSLPTPHKRWVPRLSHPAPHEPHSYFPMSLYQ